MSTWMLLKSETRTIQIFHINMQIIHSFEIIAYLALSNKDFPATNINWKPKELL